MTDTPGKNPYRPGAAVPPLFLAGRSSETARFRRVLEGSPELPANIRLTGLRGVGKTVLLKEFERIADEELEWLTNRVQIEPRHNREQDISRLLADLADLAALKASRAARLRRRAKEAVAAARSALRVTYEDVEFSLAPGVGEKQEPLLKALYDATKMAVEQGHTGYLVMLDEAQVLRDERARDGEHPVSLVIAAFNGMQELGLPLALVLCGLPTLRANLLNARTYSERMFRGEEIGSLEGEAAVDAFVRPLDETGVTASESLVTRVVEEVKGYPYFIQFWGAELWEAARIARTRVFDNALLDEIEQDIYDQLDGDFYERRVEALTPSEQDLLISTADCPYPPLRTADIHSRSAKREGNVNVLMGRLADQGVIYRVQKGIYRYTAPGFHDFLLRRRQRLQSRRA